MPTAVTALDLTKSFGAHTLFSGVALRIADEDRLGLIGPNGAGKSTLLRILAGLEETDEGTVTRRRGLRVAYVAQDDPFDDDATPLAAVTERYRPTGADHGPDAETRASMVLSRLGFDRFDQTIGTLSGGWRKRVSLAGALVNDPDVLMLDEPTNHLDLEGVIWLERFVASARMAVAVITHDRTFLEATANRIVELSAAYPGGSFEVDGNYSEFVKRKALFLDAQAQAQNTLANTVRRDTAWLQQGIQGRQTRNKSQVDDSRARRAELGALKARNAAPTQTTDIDFQATDRKTRKLLTLHGVTKAMGGRPLFADLDLVLTPGRRIGLVGPNGAGKTTLLRLISGAYEPDSGRIERADTLRIVTFSQHREALDPELTLHQALCPVGDTVHFRGRPIHISGWARRFLFASSQLRTFVRELSGGEQARVLMANLMLEPADVLLLDEPTNDLDIPSIEVLERAVLDFPGAVMLVTHDRFMMRRLATEFLALDGRGGAFPHASYEQWQAASERRPPDDSRPRSKTERPKTAPKKLSYKLQREADGMEQAILAAEAEVESLEAQIAEPHVIADHAGYAEACTQLGEAQARVRALYERWAELEALSAG